MRACQTAASILLVLLSVARPAWAQRTDVVVLVNGDRITGEIVKLDRGQLQFKTDNEGTIYVEWDKVIGVDAARQFEVATSDGRRFLGGLQRAADGFIQITGASAGLLSIPDVTRIAPIGASFWQSSTARWMRGSTTRDPAASRRPR